MIVLKKVQPTIAWDTVKAMMRGNLISRVAYMNKVERLRYEKWQEELKKLEKQKQTDKDVTGQLKEVRRQLDATLTDELEKKIRFTKQTFHRSGPKAAKNSGETP